ncbi:hypothetical protein FNH05_08645 [Amycolatopsis rhizosphaerae]|uniref:Uncharacterized protein n=1 Tax=Amycolatopsis rhizosphaerae TaxID=2053003 RepID=A0A558D543_9PSEU|nr:hypothetical protein [Amycolatopsis rhizosphaerae]TVT56122.1 hypothetical protein FNH05_08645 [Amycolatopsis rhizosphaerae]
MTLAASASTWQAAGLTLFICLVALAGRHYGRRRLTREARDDTYAVSAQIDVRNARKHAAVLMHGSRRVRGPLLFITRDLLGGYLILEEEALTWIPGRWATFLGAQRLCIPVRVIRTVVLREKLLLAADSPATVHGQGFQVTFWLDDQRKFLAAMERAPRLYALLRRD